MPQPYPFVPLRGFLIDWHVSSAPKTSSSPGPIVTGTVLYTAVSVLLGIPNSVSSDLESLLYSLIAISCDGKLPWRHAHSEDEVLGSKLHVLRSFDLRDRALRKLEVKRELVPLIESLSALFWPSDTMGYCTSVSPDAFVAVCEAELRRLSTARTFSSGPPTAAPPLYPQPGSASPSTSPPTRSGPLPPAAFNCIRVSCPWRLVILMCLPGPDAIYVFMLSLDALS